MDFSTPGFPVGHQLLELAQTHLYIYAYIYGDPDGKESAPNAGDSGLTPGLNREKGMATHSRILAWRIPWTEEPGGLQSMGLQRVRHN